MAIPSRDNKGGGMKATDIFTAEEIETIKLICKIFNGKVVNLGEERNGAE